ncbi:MAG TPA: lipid kinase [Kineosporiaceae bacterium]|nr:lipid kinase [Kineosporiaceae bacterium]
MTLPDAVLIVNSTSRSGRTDFDLARERLTELGLPLVGAHAVENPMTIPGIVDDAIKDGVRLVVLGGGDGTVSLVAPRLAGTDVVLGLLPTGTANDLARTLQLPSDLAAACSTVVHGKVVDVDLGVVGEDHFLNVASVGLAVGVTEALSPGLKRRAGRAAYPIAAVQAYRKHVPFRARLEFPDGDHEPVDLDDLLQVAVANGRFYGGGSVVAPQAGIDDHLLDVYAIPRGTMSQRLQVARHFVSGAFTERDHVLHLTTRAVRLITDPELPINVDGELSARTPARFGILRNGLKVLVPQNSDAAQLDERPATRRR